VAQAKRRRFTAEYKRRILAEAGQAKGSGGVDRSALGCYRHRLTSPRITALPLLVLLHNEAANSGDPVSLLQVDAREDADKKLR
jgi:hypothetical protein